MIILKS